MLPIDDESSQSCNAIDDPQCGQTAACSCCLANAFLIFSDCASRLPRNSALALAVRARLPDAMSISSSVIWPSGRLLRIEYNWNMDGEQDFRFPTRPVTSTINVGWGEEKGNEPLRQLFIAFVIVNTFRFPWWHLKCLSPMFPTEPFASRSTFS